MSVDYRRSHLAANKGESYHREFSESPYRRMVWQLERAILDRILMMYPRNCEIHHLDFACGTGRILGHYKNRVTTSVGVDVSPSMLEVARKDQHHSELIEADLTEDDVLRERKFNLITAFRFFPNAEPELRMKAMQVLVRHLHESGYMVFNNHKHTGSTRNRLARLCGRTNYKGMSMSDVEGLLAANDMEIVKTYHLCVFPASEKRVLLPPVLLRHIEGVFARCTLLRNFGENLIFVCRRCRSEHLQQV